MSLIMPIEQVKSTVSTQMDSQKQIKGWH